MTRAFGDHGWFSEGQGPSHLDANTCLVPFFQAARVAAGKDWITPRPNVPWMTLRWVFDTIPGEAAPGYPHRNPGAYGTEVFLRDGTSEGGEFCQGFGAISEPERAAVLWTYRHVIEPGEVAANPRFLKAGEPSFDAIVYPHRAMLAFINWPIGIEPRNPAEVLGTSVYDRLHGYTAFRNQWRDRDDILVTALTREGPTCYVKYDAGPVMVWGLGLRTALPVGFNAFQVTAVAPRLDRAGGTVAYRNKTGERRSLAVDFSGACGAPALIVAYGPAKMPYAGDSAAGSASAVLTSTRLGDQPVTVMTLQRGTAPPVEERGDTIVIGQQVVSWNGESLILAR